MTLPLEELVIGGYWAQGAYRMISASGEAEKLTYDVHMGKSGRRWLVPTHGRAENLIVEDLNPNSQGFGGRTLTFNLSDGSTLSLKGPWSSNSSALFADTGIDLSTKYMTWGCIGRYRGSLPSKYGYRSVVCDLLYWDPKPGIFGEYSRIEQMAAKLANERNELLAVYSQSYSGSICSIISPDASKLATDELWDKYREEFGDTREWAKLEYAEEPLVDWSLE